MTTPEAEDSQAHLSKLLLERQAAKELYQAVSVGIGATPTETQEQEKIEDPFQLFIRKGSAIELLNSLAGPLDFAPAPTGKDGQAEGEVVFVVIRIPTALVLLNALTITLGGAEPVSNDNDVEVVLKKYVAVDLLNALIVNLGPIPGGGKKGKSPGKMQGKL